MHLIRSYLLLPFVEAVEARGFDAVAMLAAHGLKNTDLVEPHFRLPFSAFLAIQQRAADLVGDPCLGLRIGAEIRSEQVGSLGLLMATSRTLHEALTHFSRWGNAIGEGWAFELIDTPEGADYVYRVDELGVSTRQDVEYSLANLCSLIRTRMGRGWAPVEVHLGHSNPSRANPSQANPSPTRVYQGIFNATVFFDQPVNKLVIARDDLLLRSERVSYALLPIVEAHLQLAADKAASDGDLLRQVGLIVAQSMGRRPAQIGEVALKLGMPVRSQAGGFCYLNNTAIAANWAASQGVRVAIIDVDVHHGNGTQALFYDRRDVLTVSVHGDPAWLYPYYAGYADEIGTGIGEGFNLNLPVPLMSDSEAYLAAVARGCEAVRQFSPDIVVVALGLDAFRDDPFACMAVDDSGFLRMGEILGTLSRPTLIVQEGGYPSPTLGVSLAAFLRGFAAGQAR